MMNRQQLFIQLLGIRLKLGDHLILLINQTRMNVMGNLDERNFLKKKNKREMVAVSQL